MAKNSITDYSKTAALNTDIQSVDIDEGCLPSGINNAIREIMADLADMNDGTVSLTSPSFAAASITGALTSGSATVGSTTSSAAVHSYTKLEIESSSHTALQLSGSTGGEQWIWFADDSSSTPVGGITYYHGGPYMGFRVEGSERLRIDSSGNVGIGTSSPSVPLEVNVSGAGDVFKLTRDTGTNGELNIDFNGANANFNSEQGGFTFETSSTANAMRIESSGNVGIGTAGRSASGYTILGVDNATNGGVIEVLQNGTIKGQLFYDGTQTHLRSGLSTDLVLDTNDTERMRIDSSGNVLVGHTSTYSPIGNGGIGVTLGASGEIFAGGSQSSGVMLLNREDSDGNIITFRKDGTTVGSIGTVEGDIYVGTGDTGLLFNDANNQIRPYNSTAQNSIDNAIDIGRSASRFKDLYLGGGVYLGGTGSANHLDDYEEGTWTPTYIGSTTNPTITYDRQNGHYVKIGRQVIATVEIRTDAVSGGSGNIYVGGLPFTPVTVSGQVRSGTANVGYTSAFNGSNPQAAYLNGDFNAVILGTNSGTDARGPLETAISVSNLGTGANSNFLMATVIYIAS